MENVLILIEVVYRVDKYGFEDVVRINIRGAFTSIQELNKWTEAEGLGVFDVASTDALIRNRQYLEEQSLWLYEEIRYVLISAKINTEEGLACVGAGSNSQLFSSDIQRGSGANGGSRGVFGIRSGGEYRTEIMDIGV